MVVARTCSEPGGLTDVWALTPLLGLFLSEEHADLGVLPRGRDWQEARPELRLHPTFSPCLSARGQSICENSQFFSRASPEWTAC